MKKKQHKEFEDKNSWGLPITTEKRKKKVKGKEPAMIFETH